MVQAIQAAGVFCASLLAGVDTASGKSYHVNSGIAITIIGVLTAVALGYVAYGLARVRQWSRTPALICQFITGIVSIYVVQSRQYDWGVPGVLLAVAGSILLLVPPSVRALAHHAEPAAPAQRRR